MSPSALSIFTCLVLLPVCLSAGYQDGDYDISARDTGYLCSLMDEYKKTGKQPDIISNPSTDYPKSKYIKKGGPVSCWVNKWYPCGAADKGKQKPCGWYKMERADDSRCA